MDKAALEEVVDILTELIELHEVRPRDHVELGRVIIELVNDDGIAVGTIVRAHHQAEFELDTRHPNELVRAWWEEAEE